MAVLLGCLSSILGVCVGAFIGYRVKVGKPPLPAVLDWTGRMEFEPQPEPQDIKPDKRYVA